MPWLLLALCVIGFLVASYFTGVAYHWLRPDTRWIPAFCRMGKDACASIIFAPQARIFGVPNSVVGQLFYLAVATAVLTGGLDQSVARLLLTAVSGVAVFLGAYLTYALLVVLRVHCILCYTSHAINLMLLALLVATS